MKESPKPAKRVDSLGMQAVQEGNANWWESNPMSYDWHGTNNLEPLTREWFREVDARFIAATRFSSTEHLPFDRIIPFNALQGKRVLEIGCGMGLHSQLMAQAGAQVTAIDLTSQAIETTKRRFALEGLTGNLLRADAEDLPFEDNAFDFVWSWGVIHHSSRTGRIVREMSRVLQPSGEVRVMVYRRDGIPARITFIKQHLLQGGFALRSWEETLFRSTDGFSARYYVRDQFEDLFRAFFQDVESEVLGQEADALPLPRRLRSLIAPLVSERTMRALQKRWGGFIFLTAKNVAK